MLHIVNKSPYEKSSLESCLAHASSGSALLLIEDGVYAVGRNGTAAKLLQEAMKNLTVYVLGPDLSARGFGNGDVTEGIKVVNYAEFVDLVIDNPIVQSWL